MKKATFILQHGGGSYQLVIKNSDKNDDWFRVNNEIVFDYQMNAVKQDLENDGYRVEVKRG